MIDSLYKLKTQVENSSLLKSFVEAKVLTMIHHKGEEYPVFCFSIGPADPHVPVLFITGGVHGIERIGAQLAWSLLKTTLDRLVWDKAHQELFAHIRLVIIPLVNPVGYKKFKRCNGNDVDLMRNSPVESKERFLFPLGGQRFSKKLPWYQGEPGVFEEENKAVTKQFFECACKSPCVISLDFHSGFGMKDRLWFPFSFTKEPVEKLPQIHALFKLFEESYPYHVYKIEPQSASYLISGDLWDYLYLEMEKRSPDCVFIPLTLEMGSWSWVKKNPMQLFSRQGIYNPVKEHRLKRTYRRHNLLFDFALKALYSHSVWSQLPGPLNKLHTELAYKKWYE